MKIRVKSLLFFQVSLSFGRHIRDIKDIFGSKELVFLEKEVYSEPSCSPISGVHSEIFRELDSSLDSHLYSSLKSGIVVPFLFILAFLISIAMIPSLVLADSLSIRNIGQIGFNGTSNDYTSLTTVILDISGSSMTNCTCNNYNGSNTYSYVYSYSTWSSWKPCKSMKYWFTDPVIVEGNSVKLYVRCLVNHTNGSTNVVNDSIIYDPRGIGLDKTPPESFDLSGIQDYPGEYLSPKNTSVFYINWTRAYDSESYFLKIPMLYSYTVIHEYGSSGFRTNSTIIAKTSTGTSNYATIDFRKEMINRSENFSEGDNVYFIISASNSAGLETSEILKKTVEKEAPVMTFIDSDLISNSSWYTFGDANLSSGELLFSWNATDSLSGLYCFNHVLSRYANATIPDVCQGTVGHFSEYTNYLLKGIRDKIAEGRNYFLISARDKAGNWGIPVAFTINMDNLPPRRPVLQTGLKNISGINGSGSRGIYFNWSSSDDGCGIVNHYVQVADSMDFTDLFFDNYTGSSRQYFNFSAYKDGTYYIRVKAIDCKGHESSFSDIFESSKKNEQLVFLSYSPTGDVGTYSPAIELNTNRNAVCSFMLSGNNVGKYGNYSRFSYTNSTMHASLVHLSPGEFYASVICNDSVDQISTGFSFKILQDYYISSASISSYRKEFSYGEKVSFILDVVPRISRLSKENIKLFERKILEEEMDQSSYFIIDLGNGKYMISFDSPKDKGTHKYFLRLFKGNEFFTESNEISFEVDDPRLYFSFEQSGLALDHQVSNYDNIIYSTVEKYNASIGIAGFGNDVSIDPNYFLLSVPYSEPVFFFSTARSFDPSKREDMLYYREFLNVNNPSFGFFLSDEYDYKTMLYMDDVTFVNDYKITEGKKSLMIQNTGLDEDGRKIVFVSSSKTQNSTGDSDG